MTSSASEKIKALMAQLETERRTATSELLRIMDLVRFQAEQMADFDAFPAGIAEEARQLHLFLAVASVRIQKLAQNQPSNAG